MPLFKGPNPYGDMPDDVRTGVMRFDAVQKPEESVHTGPFHEKSEGEQPSVPPSPSEIRKDLERRRRELDEALKMPADPGPSPTMNTRTLIKNFDEPVGPDDHLDAKGIRALHQEMKKNAGAQAEDILKPVSAAELKRIREELRGNGEK